MKNSCNKRGLRRGFTLIEVVIALGMMAALMAVLSAALRERLKGRLKVDYWDGQ